MKRLLYIVPVLAFAALAQTWNVTKQETTVANVGQLNVVVPSGVWTPASESGLTVWLEADKLTASDGDVIATWSDSSGNGNDITGSSGQRPLYTNSVAGINKPALYFDGSDDMLTRATFTGGAIAQPFTVFIVFKAITPASGSWQYVFDGGANNNAMLAIRGGVGDWDMLAGSQLIFGEIMEDWRYWTLLYNGNSSVAKTNNVTYGSGAVGANSMNGLTVGNTGGGGSPTKCNVALVLIYSGDKTGVTAIKDYIANKYFP